MSVEILDAPAAAESATLAERRRRRGLFFLCAAVAAVGVAMTLQLALNSNFVAGEMKLRPEQQGILEAVRESCGVFALVILALLAGLAEPLVGAAMLVLVGVGLGSYAFVPDFTWIVITSLVWSQGLHVWMPLPNSMALALAEKDRAGATLGRVASAGAIGSVTGLGGAILLHYLGLHIRGLWLVAGAAGLIGAACCLFVPRQIMTPRPRLVIRRRYGLYYTLSFLEGWRKQIFVAFAGYLLVHNHGTPLSTMLWLWLAMQAIGWQVAPLIGRWIDRAGERRVLCTYYATMTAVFLGYAVVGNVWVLYALFVADSVFFSMNMAATTYVNRIAPPSEHTPTLSMGVAMNHVAAVCMPLVGGMLWRFVGYKWLFLLGAAVALASIGVAMRVPRRPTSR